MGQPSADDVRQLVLEKVQLADDGDYYGLLGVDANANKAQVQKAYFGLAKVLHPDRVARHGLDDVQAEAARAFQALSDAYNTLIDADKRKAHDLKRARAARKSAPTGPNTAELQRRVGPRSTQELLRDGASDLGISPSEAGKIFSHKGSMLLKKGATEDALKFFRRALESDQENARYNQQLGWAIFMDESQDEKKRVKEAKRYIEKAVKLDPDNAEAHYYLARVFKSLGDTAACKKHLEEAIARRPNYIEVKRELRLIDLRESRGVDPTGKGDKRSGGGRWPFGLDRLFKKK